MKKLSLTALFLALVTSAQLASALELEVNIDTGEIYAVGTVELNGIEVISDGGYLDGSAATSAPFAFNLGDQTDSVWTAGVLGTIPIGDNEDNPGMTLLGAVYNGPSVGDLTFRYGSAEGTSDFSDAVAYIPEPSTILLLGLGMLGLIGTRRK